MQMKIKGFDHNLCCRGMQFEIGKEYRIESKGDPLRLCTDSVFHYCERMKDVHKYYPVDGHNRYCEIEVLGDEVTSLDKSGSDHIRIVREIKGEEMQSLLEISAHNTGYWCKGDYNTGHHNAGNHNTGNNNSGSYNVGTMNDGIRNTGNGNYGSLNTGDNNFGSCNAGDWNYGEWNTGDHNSGNQNSGDENSGERNSGNQNAGLYNTGNCNSGSFNTGGFNSADCCTGFFCTKEDPEIRLFNKPSGMTQMQFRESVFWEALHSVRLPLTDEKVGTYKEACQLWWGRLTEENRNIIRSMPNFDAEIFREITGIDTRWQPA